MEFTLTAEKLMTPAESTTSVSAGVLLCLKLKGGIYMAVSLALIIVLGLLANFIFEKLNLPGLLGMLITGILIGPFCFNLIDGSILTISSDLRKIALIIILIRAGLGINKKQLKSIGKPALKMSCIPGILEGLTIAVVATIILNFTFIQGGILGFILAAVSPAVVVPEMLNLIEKKTGTDKNIPTLILTAASIDDVFAITLMTTFMGLYMGSNVNVAAQILSIPVSILLGILAGVLSGIALTAFFKKVRLSSAKSILIVLSMSILLNYSETLLKNLISMTSLLGVMTLGFVIADKIPLEGEKLSKGFSSLWSFAQIILFVLVGAQVNIQIALSAGLISIIIIAAGLLFRSLGVIISLNGSELNFKEKLFCVAAYVPKATVQAAMGGLPLAMGVASGELILAISVLSILITAPIGAVAIRILSKTCLNHDTENPDNIEIEKIS